VTVPLADVHFEPFDEALVAHLEGEIDMSNAEELGTALSSQVPREVRALILDLRQVGYVDSFGIRLIFNLRKRLGHRGTQLRLVVEPEAAICEALRVAGVPQAIGALETIDAALHSLDD
jgi:anti-anti-sigma factor